MLGRACRANSPGVPAPVVRRAAALLPRWRRHGGPLGTIGAPEALPLFAAAGTPPRDQRCMPEAPDPIDLTRLTPQTLEPDTGLTAARGARTHCIGLKAIMLVRPCVADTELRRSCISIVGC